MLLFYFPYKDGSALKQVLFVMKNIIFGDDLKVNSNVCINCFACILLKHKVMKYVIFSHSDHFRQVIIHILLYLILGGNNRERDERDSILAIHIHRLLLLWIDKVWTEMKLCDQLMTMLVFVKDLQST